MPFVLMKIFEEAPRRFDSLMQILTFGKLRKIRQEVVSHLVEPESTVLEIGCGTGSLLKMLAERGARVVGIDAADEMVEVAQENLAGDSFAQPAEVKKLHALQVEDEFAPGSFDRVISILALSEMSDDEIDSLLPQCRQVLELSGRLVLVDEVEPERFFPRLLYKSYRWIARLLTFLGLQAVELQRANLFLKILYFVIEVPLMVLTFLVVPPLTHPLADIEGRIERSGFRLLRKKSFLGGSLQLFYAEAI